MAKIIGIDFTNEELKAFEEMKKNPKCNKISSQLMQYSINKYSCNQSSLEALTKKFLASFWKINKKHIDSIAKLKGSLQAQLFDAWMDIMTRLWGWYEGTFIPLRIDNRVLELLTTFLFDVKPESLNILIETK